MVKLIILHNVPTDPNNQWEFEECNAVPEQSNKVLVLTKEIGCAYDDTWTFSDEDEVNSLGRSLSIVKICRIAIQHGAAVMSLQATYQLSDGSEYTAQRHGDAWQVFATYKENVVELRDSEFIIGISGRHNSSWIREISFVIGDRKDGGVRTVGPFGNCKGFWWYPLHLDIGDWFEASVSIVAFAGRCRKPYGLQETLVALSFAGIGIAPKIIP